MTPASGIPKYSRKALEVRDLFYSGIVDTHFFVEDEDQENLYHKIFKRIFPKIANFKVFPLNGKKSVIAHAKATKPADKVKRVYVLDKDFDDLLGRMLFHPGVFYLDDYCIENALLDEVAMLQFAIEERPKLRRTTIKSRLSYVNTMTNWLPLLDRLHRAFYIVQRNDLGIENCDCAPEKFTARGAASVLDVNKIDDYINVVANRLIEKLVISEPGEIEGLLNSAFGNKRVGLKHVNGKFLVKLFFHRLKSVDLMGNVRIDSMVFRLASNSSFGRLRDFKRRVNAYLKA